MKIFHGKAVIGYSVEVENDNASIEEIKKRIADGMAWYYFANFKPEEIFNIEEVPKEVYFGEE